MAKEKMCYYCGKKASSREHVPPKCIFLDSVDGKKNKNNLITVPSCYEHNTAKKARINNLSNSIFYSLGEGSNSNPRGTRP